MAFPYSIGVLDDFNRADAANLGANWTQSGVASNHLTIITNACRAPSGGSSGYSDYWNASQFGPDCACYITCPFASGGDLLLGVRSLGGTRTQYEVYIDF